MKQQIVIIHGGNAFNTYEEYLAHLRAKEVTLERLSFRDWKKRLSEILGDKYDVLAPQMPNAQNARYEEWKIWFEKFITFLSGAPILIGHSLGGIFLAKYLSENELPKKILATFLVAAPYDEDGNPDLREFVPKSLERCEAQGGKIFLYHSTDDPVVPFVELSKYQTRLPNAIARVFEDRGHFNMETFPEIVEDIKKLA